MHFTGTARLLEYNLKALGIHLSYKPGRAVNEQRQYKGKCGQVMETQRLLKPCSEHVDLVLADIFSFTF